LGLRAASVFLAAALGVSAAGAATVELTSVTGTFDTARWIQDPLRLIAAPLPMINVDTDMIIPKQFRP
jgi:hypothetical protein